MFLQGYGPLLLNGTWQTVKLAVLSLAFAFVLGLLGAAAKLSKNRFSYGVGTVYTTLVRGVPDLVLMLLLFYSIQIWLNNLTDLLGWDQIDIDPFVAGVAVLGFIYGAYFTLFAGAISLVITTVSNFVLMYLEKRYSTGVRKADL
jgi:histidine transport system permease protein